MATPTASASLTDATTGAGSTVDFTTAVTNVSMMLVPSVGVTAGVVSVEASHDGTNWVKLDGFDASVGFNQAHRNSGGAFRYWRANVIADVVGGTVTATFMEAG
jgi:hypothetical protein